jgi:hypothetical protein
VSSVCVASAKLLSLCVAGSATHGQANQVRKSRGIIIIPSSHPPLCSGYCAADDIPFSDRKALRQVIEDYDDPSKRPLKEFFELLSKEKSALLLVGDSVMQQFYSAIACELEREGVWKDPAKFTNTDEIQHVHDVPIKFAPVYHFVNSKFCLVLVTP